MFDLDRVPVSQRRTPVLVLAWYVTFFAAMAIAPLDPKVWWSLNLLPLAFVATLIATQRVLPLSNASYLLIALWLTMHTIAAHYTYPKVPVGYWLDQVFAFHRNHFDRIVHFMFGFVMALPLAEIFRRRCQATGWLLPYLVIMTILAFSGFWEILEAWAGQLTHPDLERALVGHQGDVWDPQRDMAAALYGSIVCTGGLAWLGKLYESGGTEAEEFADDRDFAFEPVRVGTNGMAE